MKKIIEWPFSLPPNTAVFTSKKIVFGNEWIYYVSHDEEDGAWQFHPPGFTREGDEMIVGLGEICELDSSVLELWDLPYGWFAWRKGPCEQWEREKKQNDKE